MNQGIIVPWDEINEFDTLATGVYQFEGKMEIGESGTGKLAAKVTHIVMQPIEMAGRISFETLTLGTNENPKNFVKDSPGASTFKKLMKAAQVPKGSLEQMAAGFNGSQYVAKVLDKLQPDDADFRPGERINRFLKYGRLGEMEVGIAPAAPSAGTGMISAPPLPPGMVAPVQQNAPVQQPVYNAAPQGIPVQPAVPQGAPVVPSYQNVPPVNNTPSQPAQQQVAPQAVQQQVITPQQPVSQVPPIVPPQPVQANEQMIKCTICGADVPISQLAEHVKTHIPR